MVAFSSALKVDATVYGTTELGHREATVAVTTRSLSEPPHSMPDWLGGP